MTQLDVLIDEAKRLLKQSHHAIALTGAGVSTASGIPDFRTPGSGAWENVDPMEVASIYAFRQRPQSFYKWLHPMARIVLDAEPNPAHTALAQMETDGPLQGIITQNIDMLHTKAGSQTIYEVHGHLRQATCLHCQKQVNARPFLQEFVHTGDVPRCPDCRGVLKPNVILFGELLPADVLNRAQAQTMHCDLMLVAGSSLEVAPIGDLPIVAKQYGAKLIIVNLSPTHADSWADVVIRADVVEVLPRLAKNV